MADKKANENNLRASLSRPGNMGPEKAGKQIKGLKKDKSDIALGDLDIKWDVGGIKKEWWGKVTIVGAPQHEGSGKEEDRRSPENSSAKTSFERHSKYLVWGFVFSEDNWYLFVTQVTVWVEICLQDFSEGLLKSE